jgi:uncharacterized protein (DUF1778 family)
MTYRIDLTEEKQRLIEAAAARLGVAVETFIAHAAETQAENDVVAHNPLIEALAMLDTLAPTLRAGTVSHNMPIDAATDLQALREERFSDAAH